MPPASAALEPHVVAGGPGRVEVLRAASAGPGAPVVLVHASGMGAGRWGRLAGQLVERHPVHCPQLVGYGETGPFDPRTWTLDDDVAAVEAAVEAAMVAAGRPVHLVGHSFGGWLALRVALRRPAWLQSLALYEPTTFGLLHEVGDAEGLADLARFYDDPWFLDPAHGGSDPWLGAFVDYWNQAEFWAVMGPAQRAPLQAVGAKVFAEVRAVLGDRTRAATWAAIDRPIRVLLGARTTPAADRATRLLCAALAGVEPVMIERAGHLAPLVRVGPIGERLLAHFAAHEPGGPGGVAIAGADG